MRYGSVCSGIEAGTAAWHPLGWRPAFFSEIDAFPRAVLAHHYPDVPLHGDFTTIGTDEYGSIDLLVGGTPCQSFSVAGLRKGLDDDRGNLALEYLRLADRKRPRWLVWENVPGALSSNGGRDFGAFLGALAEIGYGFAYRVFDAQYFGVPQRRRRVFVVGYLGDWRRAAAVLFERESLSGHPAPSRKAQKDAAARIARSLAIRGRQGVSSAELGDEVANAILTPSGGRSGIGVGAVLEGPAHTLRGEGFDASEDGTGRGTPLVPVPSHDPACTLTAREWKGPLQEADLSTVVSFHTTQDPIHGRDVCHSLSANANANANATAAVAIQERAVSENPNAGPGGAGFREDVAYTLEARQTPQAVAFSCKDHGADAGEIAPTLRSMSHHGSHANGGGQVAIAGPAAVRRLTPTECERLQGFPDEFTRIPYRNKPPEKCPDGPRYKALGNSMAVPCMSWIGQRIQMVEDILKEEEE